MTRTRRSLLILALGGLLVGAAAYCSIDFAPAVLAPLAQTFMFPAFELERRGYDPGPWFLLLPVLAYALSALPLVARDRPRVVLSLLIYGLAVLLSALFFPLCWEGGVKFQGFTYTVLVAAENVAFAVALGLILWAGIWRPSAAKAWSFHIVLFVWLSWVAFPWLGEMP
jgi:hypothetical protein